MRWVLTLELLGTGVDASELAVVLISDPPHPFCVDKIHVTLGNENVSYANVKKPQN